MYIQSDHPITAILYSNGAEFELFLQGATATMAGAGMRLAGLIQYREPTPDRAKCDIHLRDLATGNLHAISDDRGPHARGCILNTDRLLRACETAMAGLTSQTDALVLCKFGKTEVEGGGFRALIARALDLGVPVLIGLPAVNLQAFREYAGEFAQVVELAELSMNARVVAPLIRADRRSRPASGMASV